MNRIIPFIILLAIILAFVFSAKMLGTVLIILLLMSIANAYSDIKNRTTVFGVYSVRYIMAKLFFWNRIVNGRVSFYFDLANLDYEKEFILGGISFGTDFVSLCYDYDEDEEDYCEIYSISNIKNVVHKGLDYHLPRSIRYVSMHFSHQQVLTTEGKKWVIVYWVMTDNGEKIINGKIVSDKKKWTIILPDRSEVGLKVEINA
jgi:hypothetical protein